MNEYVVETTHSQCAACDDVAAAAIILLRNDNTVSTASYTRGYHAAQATRKEGS